jgi:hypothetical protein
VLARTTGGFAISNDLGKNWRHVQVRGHPHHRFIHLKSIGNSELLAQALAPETPNVKDAPLDLLVLSEDGEVLAEHRAQGHRWHSCRAVDFSGGTLMYAEYPSNKEVKKRRPTSCRVFRSRDRGRSWQIVFERTGQQIRHFHFLQARPGFPGEWWLTSGDAPHESRIWISRDDGDNWTDATDVSGNTIDIGGKLFERSAFRLTDLDWSGDDVVWGTDDYLEDAQPPGARIFRSKIGSTLVPELVGNGRWPFRNLVDIGDFWLLLSQRAKDSSAQNKKPAVYLLPKKKDAGGLVHLFDLDTYPSDAKPGFTFSKASRAAVDGTFFSFRSGEDVFPTGHQILEWHVTIE